MHEIALCESVVAAVEARAAGRPVARVRVRAGALLRIVEPSLQQAFALLAAGTPAEDAVVEMVEVPAAVHCNGCGHDGETVDVVAACPLCGGHDVQFSGGDELILESLTLRDPVAHTGSAAVGGGG